ncbi:hypothetical protein [Flavobacterium poyangense]|uniref:hypothetical protein n=1 Tax=Flavobacterium poyangense TaxID=2204302 RepID=UPI00141D93D2|nr:hypothetical protein [Flavobacterium sp. JXAS1]
MNYFLNGCNKTRFLFLVILATLFSTKCIAQEIQIFKYKNPSIPYKFEAQATTFNYLVGGTIVNEVRTTTSLIPIGFDFNFSCTTYSSFYASSNGTLCFDTAFPTSDNWEYQFGYKKNPNILAPLWDILDGNAGIFSYATTGTAPNRVFTAEWKNWKWNATKPNISFQVKLYEGTNTIEYIYNQEGLNETLNEKSASIGVFNGRYVNTIDRKQGLWLNNSTSNPDIFNTLKNQINIRPATGQLYRFTYNETTESCESTAYGRTVINDKGGTNATDGLKIILTGAANMQIIKNNTGQIFPPKSNLEEGTSLPYKPGTGESSGFQGLILAIGGKKFHSGSLSQQYLPEVNRLNVISSTEQRIIETSPGHYENTIKLSAVIGSQVYYLTIKYTYDFPKTYFLIDYNVDIPPGNTEDVKLVHGWDTYLANSDRGPGFVKGNAPKLIMGVVKTPSYEAFEYVGGIPWSGYFSSSLSNLYNDLGNSMTYKNTILTDPNIDNAIGISINFGNLPGSFTSSNKLVIGCEAGDVMPALTASTSRLCAGVPLNLNNFITSQVPTGSVVVWKNETGITVADPTMVTIGGKYSVSFYSDKYNCNSPINTITITVDNSCAVCYKSAVTTGKETGSLTSISTLNKENKPGLSQRNGALILESKEKGFAISKIASPETKIAVPVEGMLVYDPASHCLKLYNGSSWHCIEQSCTDN